MILVALSGSCWDLGRCSKNVGVHEMFMHLSYKWMNSYGEIAVRECVNKELAIADP